MATREEIINDMISAILYKNDMETMRLFIDLVKDVLNVSNTERKDFLRRFSRKLSMVVD